MAQVSPWGCPAETALCRPAPIRLCRAPVAALNGGQPRQSGSGVLCLEPPEAVSRGHDRFRGAARPGSGGAQAPGSSGGLLADAAVDPLPEQISVAEVAGVLL